MKYVPARRNSYLFDDLFDDMFPSFNTRNTALMKTDIREKDGKYLLDIDLPGYQKEDIKISIFNGNLTISAEHNESNEEKDAKGNILRKERYSGSCSRTFYVGDAIKESDIHASFTNGILTIDFPSEAKKQEEETKYIDIL
ncbi:MAG: Hsp20/alpha crystallin family protein [Solobacterium sp.]|nr:Hsp20/alpha crystallin family protein [Solobacterium sp.]MBQ6222980.1 Hsp20/alpha crystallin family protein [Solobacterium sp.]MBR2668864.1 Hsp20/alpha crystallin family protein [Solobacterium sp.]